MKTYNYTVRFSASERAAIDAAASELGLSTGEFVRRAVFRAAKLPVSGARHRNGKPPKAAIADTSSHIS